MLILWDEHKRLANLDKHGLDFAWLGAEFFENAVVVPVRSGRLMAVGHFAGRPVAVIFSRLGTEALSIISMRVASIRERRLIS